MTCSYLSWFVLLFDLDSVSPTVYISVTTYQKSIRIWTIVTLEDWRIGNRIMTPGSLPLGGDGGKNNGHLNKVLFCLSDLLDIYNQ